MKALILSCGTGQGHNAAGSAIKEAMQRRGIDCEMRDATALASKQASKIVNGTYMNMAAYAPRAFGVVYRLGDAVSRHTKRSPVYYANTACARELYEFIMRCRFDTVICPHLFPAETLTYLKRSRGLKARCYGVMTDYTCSPFWEETDMDGYFIPHGDLLPEFGVRGIPRDRMYITGIPVSGRFSLAKDKTAARQRLAIDMDTAVYLIMTGSMGSGDIMSLPEQILNRTHRKTRVIVMTGKNERLKAAVSARYSGEQRVTVQPFTSCVHVYMDAADVVITKPGGLSSTEAAVRNLPIVHTSPIPGCETMNAMFFYERGMSRFGDSPGTSARIASMLAYDEHGKDEMMRAQRENVNPRAADDIIDICVG